MGRLCKANYVAAGAVVLFADSHSRILAEAATSSNGSDAVTCMVHAVDNVARAKRQRDDGGYVKHHEILQQVFSKTQPVDHPLQARDGTSRVQGRRRFMTHPSKRRDKEAAVPVWVPLHREMWIGKRRAVAVERVEHMHIATEQQRTCQLTGLCGATRKERVQTVLSVIYVRSTRPTQCLLTFSPILQIPTAHILPTNPNSYCSHSLQPMESLTVARRCASWLRKA